MSAEDNVTFMERALLLGERGRGRTSPNPWVGAVVVRPDGVVVGHGTTEAPGGRHAEIVALDEAGDQARGSTLYCTLEPCSHVGRTAPCVERIVAAGVRRVVAAVADPNPLVSGTGITYLREHGVVVSEDVAREAASRQHAAFFTWIRTGRPFVIAKVAVSHDGFVSGPAGPVRLTGPIADRYLHRERAEVDAIAVGSGTILADDPRLTARVAYRGRPLVRVVFDWRGRLSPTARVFSTLAAGPVIMVVLAGGGDARAQKLRSLRDAGVTVVEYAERNLADVLRWLGGRGVTSLLVEGGPALHGAFMDARLVDRTQIVTAPVMLGSGVRSRLTDADGTRRTVLLGNDLLVEADVHGTGRDYRTH